MHANMFTVSGTVPCQPVACLHTKVCRLAQTHRTADASKHVKLKLFFILIFFNMFVLLALASTLAPQLLIMQVMCGQH